ncbi:MAG: Rpn family recombination-promoting nuclease/putative transposase [Okeania sp. SIO2C2]|uniref:Rpn family recombination-promoting nuclease/putative transposase n=1 Tax=Okeania sp. SIO2C2 TaxID=2607787 RepID=UPI0013B7056F|nr:Rpn family recombination-promoting nuclease/putative transposase [Okeania sp. SIO2C2]NEP88326.1 Rpn family recombination-promoting nuclease/putative transposase [Okeania sp. SIO2C2]
MRTDSIFYTLFQSVPNAFFELISLPETIAKNYQFDSIEVKETSFRIDGVFVPTEVTPETPIYFVEVQFQPDNNFSARFFGEIFLYLKNTKQLRNWQAVVIYPSHDVDKGDSYGYTEILENSRVSRIYLSELGKSTTEPLGLATLKLVVSDQNQTMSDARILLDRVQQEEPEPKQKESWLQLIKTILIYKLPQASREEIEAMFNLSDLKQTRFYQEAFSEGRQEGSLLAKRAAIPNLINLGLTIEQIALALELQVEQVNQFINGENN